MYNHLQRLDFFPKKGGMGGGVEGRDGAIPTDFVWKEGQLPSQKENEKHQNKAERNIYVHTVG